MKKVFLLLPCLLLLLPSCGAKNITPELGAQRVLQAWDAPFLCADEDFIQSNFAAMPPFGKATVYLSEQNDGTEFGFFEITDVKNVAAAQAAIRDYIASEREQVLSLAALYPGDELNARLARYDAAEIGATGNTAYYFIGDKDAVRAACRALA